MIIMTALENFLEQIILKKVEGSVYLLPAITDVQIVQALKEEREQGEQYPLLSVIHWVAVDDSLPDHLQKVIMYGKRTEHNEPEIITGVLNRAGGLNEWNTYGIVMYEVTQWAVIEPPCV
jgi:hypothetical protein